MAQLRIYYVYLPFLIFVCSHATSSAEGESNVYTLLFGSESTIADLHKEIKILREKLKAHHQSLSSLQKNYASLQKRLVNLEQINENLLLKLQNFIQLKLNEQSKELVQKQTNYKNTLQNILDTQDKSFKDELKKFETQVLNKMQSELDKKRDAEKQIDAKTPIEFLKNLLNNDEEIKKLPPEAVTILSKILYKIQNIEQVESNEADWPPFTTFLPNEDDKVVEVNAKPAADVKTVSSCDEALKSIQVGRVYALNMTKYNLTNMYGYCLSDPDDNGAWLVIQRRINSELSFNRNWQDYKNGFGNLADSFFIGLERLHKILLNSHAHLWIQLGTEDQESPHRFYTDFSISNEEDKYRLTSAYVDDQKDDLFDAIDLSFQTYDVENNGTNCAKEMEGGWWYDDEHDQGFCSNGNLNAKLENVIWNTVNKVVYTQMAIRLTERRIKLEIHQKN